MKVIMRGDRHLKGVKNLSIIHENNLKTEGRI
jgi:hypothetical protein